MGPALLVIGALRAKQPQRATDLVTRASTAQCQPRRPLMRRVQQVSTAQRRGCLLLRAVVCAARATTAPALRERLLRVMGPALLVTGVLRAKQPQRATDLVTQATTAKCLPRRQLTRRAQQGSTAQRRGFLHLLAVARAARATTALALQERLLPATVWYPAATSQFWALSLLQGRARAQRADTV